MSESDTTSPYLIGELPGFTPQIAHLVVMLRDARTATLMDVHGLTTEQLDHLFDEQANSIGMLLAHNAAVEYFYLIDTSEGRDLTPEEYERWLVALELGQPAREAIRGNPLSYYLDQLEEVRTRTMAMLAGRTDDWLYEQTPFWGGLPANNYFKWYHVFEDEIHHRGQIRWLRKRLPGVGRQ